MRAKSLPVFARVGALLLLSVLGQAGNSLQAPRIPLQPFSYHERFEGEVPMFSPWAEDGHSKVEFAGASEAQACEGKLSYKLDVTLQGGTFHYYGVPYRVPCEGKLKLSARIYVADGTTAKVGFGADVDFPPTHYSGCGPVHTFDKPTGEWELVEVDLVEFARDDAAGVMATNTATTWACTWTTGRFSSRAIRDSAPSFT